MEKQDVDQLATDVEAGWRRRRGEFSLADVHRTIAVGRERADLAARDRLCRSRLSGRRRLYGPRQLGDLARRRLQLRLHAAGRRAGLQHHGDRAAVALRAARHRHRAATWPRPAAMPFPRRLPGALWLLAEIAIIATDIAEVIGTAIGLNLIFGIPLELGVLITALDVFIILYLQKLGLPLGRGVDHHAARRDRALLRHPDRARRSGLGSGHPRLRADHRDRHQSADALSGARHSRRHGDAAQPLPAFRHRADPRLWPQPAGEARGVELRHSSIRPSR